MEHKKNVVRCPGEVIPKLMLKVVTAETGFPSDSDVKGHDDGSWCRSRVNAVEPNLGSEVDELRHTEVAGRAEMLMPDMDR